MITLFNRILQLFFISLLSFNTVNAAECLPDLGSGNICTAKDFTLTSAVVAGPADCTEGEIIPGGITIRVGVTPTASRRYDIGFFIANNDEPVIEGDSCTFTSLAPLEVGRNFDGDSGSGPYRNLDGDACGDAGQIDGEIFKNMVLNDVLCQDVDNDGNLDIDYALTWQKNQSYFCADPSVPSNFFPPTSSSCKAAIGNLDIPVVPPLPAPQISIEKSVSPDELVANIDGNVIYSLTITNTGTETVTLIELDDDIFNDVNGLGNCSVPQTIKADNSYHCSFPITLTGQAAGNTHTNSITATAENSAAASVNDSDDATVIFVAGTTTSIGDLVYNDLNANGIHDDNEPGISNVVVILINQDTNTQTQLTTDPDGHYMFLGLVAGNYLVTPRTNTAPLRDMVHTGGIIPHVISLANDEHYLLADFGFSQAKITVNKTASPTVVDAPSAYVVFKVIVTNVGAIDVVLTNLVDTQFGILSSSECDLSIPPTLSSKESYTCQFTKTISGNTGDEHHNSVTALAWDRGKNTHFASDSARVIFNDPANSSIGHSVWNDVNINGVYDAGEPVFDDITLMLSGTTNAVTTTNNGGVYSFSNLAAGNYIVTLNDPLKILDDYVLVSGVNPYNNPALAIGENDTNANFGYAKAEIEVTKTANQNIIYNNSNVTYSISINNTGRIPVTLNVLEDNVFGDLNGNGNCVAGGIIAAGSSYLCSFTETITLGGVGIHNNTVTATVNDSVNDIQASDSAHVLVIAVGAIGHLIWNDLNDDGIKDADEEGIDGVTIDLTDNIGTVLQSTTTASGGQYDFVVVNGTYRIHVTDEAQLLNGMDLTTGADSIGMNPSNDIIINNNIKQTINFGYNFPPPVITPSINVTKLATTSLIIGSASVTYSITVINTGPLNVTLNILYDNQFGSLNGKGSCVTGGVITVGNNYSCSFTEVLSGTHGDVHNNIVIAVAQTVSVQRSIWTLSQFAIAADKWDINFILAENIPLLSNLGIVLLIILVLLVVQRKNQV
ncbi:MAG: hypothetical protein KZQ83_14575 [gamma proteobacterium symbiont of Taylorina sp.]|nr:hypothetical protein [gamma proteobacterium symbiont of Taylorina sp.]